MADHSHDSVAVLAGGLGLTVVGASTFNVLPLLTSGASATLGFSEAQVGVMSMAFTIGSGAAAALAGMWVRSLPWRRVAALALGGLLVANSLSMVIRRDWAFMLVQGAAGFFGSSLLCLSMTILSDRHEPSRAFGVAGALQVAFQVAALLAGPTLMRLAGLNGILTVLAALSGLAFFFVPLLPSRGRIIAPVEVSSAFFKPATVAGLAGYLMFSVNIGAYWTYIELMGQARGMTARAVADGLATGISAGILGGVLAWALGDRIGRLWPISVATILTVIGAFLVSGPFGVVAFTISGMLYFFAWNYSYVYQLAIINAVDTTGRAVAITQAFGYLGGSAGAGTAALFLRPSDYSAVIWVTVIAVCLSTALFVLASLVDGYARQNHSANSIRAN
jgi:predicted MFS family arabinose efflux permease